MLNPNEIRKKVGCWSCQYCKTKNVEVMAEISCEHPSEEIRNGFQGYETALTCKGYHMLPHKEEIVSR